MQEKWVEIFDFMYRKSGIRIPRLLDNPHEQLCPFNFYNFPKKFCWSEEESRRTWVWAGGNGVFYLKLNRNSEEHFPDLDENVLLVFKLGKFYAHVRCTVKSVFIQTAAVRGRTSSTVCATCTLWPLNISIV
jgi:hypothetical protein